MLKKEKKERNAKSNLFSFSGRRFQSGSFSAAMVLVVLAIIVVINLIFTKIPNKYTDFDISQNKLYSIGEESLELLKNVEKEVTIYYLTSTVNKEYYPQLNKVLEKYEEASDKIKIVQKDPELYPAFGNSYDALETTLLIVESDKRFKLIDESEIYVLSNYEDVYYYGAAEEYEFSGENLLANAVNYVLADNLPKVYMLEGNGELELDETFKEMITDSNITLETLNLMTKDAVPEDAEALIILSPEYDLNENATKAILTYLENGGNAIIFSDYLGKDKEMPNFLSIVEAYGVTIEKGMVFEGNKNYTFQDTPALVVPEVKSHAVTNIVTEANGTLMLPNVQSIVELEDKKDTIEITTLLSTSAESYLKAVPEDSESTSKQEGDAEGPFSLAVAITDSEKSEEEEDGLGEVKTKIVLFSSSAPADVNIYAQVTPYNASLLLDTLGWMCEMEDSIFIASKSLAVEYLTLTSSQVNLWRNVFLFALPTVVIGAGLYVTYRRKRR